jgi:hypothetical protein
MSSHQNLQSDYCWAVEEPSAYFPQGTRQRPRIRTWTPDYKQGSWRRWKALGDGREFESSWKTSGSWTLSFRTLRKIHLSLCKKSELSSGPSPSLFIVPKRWSKSKTNANAAGTPRIPIPCPCVCVCSYEYIGHSIYCHQFLYDGRGGWVLGKEQWTSEIIPHSP